MQPYLYSPTAQMADFMFQNEAYRATVYRIGVEINISDFIYFLQPYNVFFLFFLGEAASWLFERAKKRDAKRKENKKSDWLFERASSRKRFHNLLTESEWYNRRLYNKYCDDGDCTTIDQVSQQSNQISMMSVVKF